MRVTVPLRVDGIDLDDESTLGTIGMHLSDALWSSVDGAVTAELEVDEERAVEAVIEFTRRVVCHLANATVRDVRRDIVSASDIAQRTGFSREAVRKWTAAQRGFPSPLATVGGGQRPTRIWLWHDVAHWLAAEYGYPVDPDWPDAATIAHIDAQLHKVPD